MPLLTSAVLIHLLFLRGSATCSNVQQRRTLPHHAPKKELSLLESLFATTVRRSRMRMLRSGIDGALANDWVISSFHDLFAQPQAWRNSLSL